jgi:hypothetical protein
MFHNPKSDGHCGLDVATNDAAVVVYFREGGCIARGALSDRSSFEVQLSVYITPDLGEGI